MAVEGTQVEGKFNNNKEQGMTTKRMCWWGKIREDKIEEYKESHREIWPELLEIYRNNGIRKISCFLRGNDLLVYSECDETVYFNGGKEAIGRSDSSQRWDAWMREFALPGFESVEFVEVFHMPPSEPATRLGVGQ